MSIDEKIKAAIKFIAEKADVPESNIIINTESGMITVDSKGWGIYDRGEIYRFGSRIF